MACPIRSCIFFCYLFVDKKGHLFVTSLLPNPILCSPYQLAKSHRLPFSATEHRSLHVLDLVHCDLWDPAPVTSTSSY